MATKKTGPAAKDTPSETSKDTEAAATKVELLKIKDFMGRVSAASEGKKKVSREAVDVVLETLGKIIQGGESFHLPPLGRGRVIKSADGMATLKVRMIAPKKPADKGAKEALADSEE